MHMDLTAVMWFVIPSGDIPDCARYSIKATISSEEIPVSDRSTTRKARNKLNILPANVAGQKPDQSLLQAWVARGAVATWDSEKTQNG